MSASAPIHVVRRLDPEDRARADFYAVLAALFADAPTAGLLRTVGAAAPLDDAPPGSLPHAWNRLLEASQAMDAEAAYQEYVDLFVGTGRSEVNLHGSHWIAGAMMEKPLVRLRHDLGALGLARIPESNLVEDHAAALFEAMRRLIEGTDEAPPAPIDTQRGFFAAHLQPWIFDCCNAIKVCPLANYYARVAEFAEIFMAIERDSFAMS
jgi:TorA maturation chaperone TorD